MSDRYVIISTDSVDKTIYNTILWDGETPFDPGEGLTTMLEADALLAGYAYPAVPVTPSDTIIANLTAAIAVNDAFLADPSPDPGAQLAQLYALTREVNGLARVATGQLDTADDT